MKVEGLPFDGGFHDVEIDGRSAEHISYQVMLLHEAGLIDAEKLTSADGVCGKPKRLTYNGHEFLDAARSDAVWRKAKERSIKNLRNFDGRGAGLLFLRSSRP